MQVVRVEVPVKKEDTLEGVDTKEDILVDTLEEILTKEDTLEEVHTVKHIIKDIIIREIAIPQHIFTLLHHQL